MSKIEYPKTPRDESVVDDYHGRKVKDPYRALEDPDSESTKEWVNQQQTVFDNLKQQFQYREVFAQKMKEMRNYPRYGTPFKEGNNYFYFYNEGLQNQDVLYILGNSLDNPRKVFIDPNTFAEDGTASIGTYAFSKPDAKYVAYCVHKSGSDWNSISIKNVETGEQLKEELKWVKFSSIAWRKDEGFFYARYPAAEITDQGTETDANKFQKVYYHKLGDDQEKDQLMYYEPNEPDWMYSVSTSYDHKYLVIEISKSCEHVNKVYYFDLDQWSSWKERSAGGFEPVKLIDHDFKSEFDFFTNTGTLFYFKTNDNAPNNKIVSLDINNPSEVKEIVPTKDVLLQWQKCVADHFILSYLKDVVDVLEIYTMDGKFVKKIEIPLGEVASTSGKRNQTEFFFKFNSFLHAGTIYKYDFTTQSEVKIRDTEVKGLNPDEFVTKQVFYTSKDGTKVPMFIVHKKDLVIDANTPHPTVLYGYGGFNVSLQPSFSISRVLWMQYFRGVFAMANIRGGEEYGEAWHQGGILGNKQNVFDDFIAAAQYLIDHHYTKPEKLAINGGSNGGLLVAAVANQAPHLFGAAWSQVPVADMLRFHKFTIGYAWISDYGSSDNPDHIDFLLAYSPVHNVKNDKRYPAILVTTADHDDRVVPLHSFKYVAELQYQLGSKEFQDLPLVIRIESKAGHGSGKSLAKQIEEAADAYGFIAHYTGAKWSE